MLPDHPCLTWHCVAGHCLANEADDPNVAGTGDLDCYVVEVINGDGLGGKMQGV
jgi:hypothetical protein